MFSAAQTPQETRTRSVPDLLLGLVGAAMMVAAVVLLFAGGEPDGAAAAAPVSVPGLRIVEPAEGAAQAGALAVVFDAGAELQRLPGGWGTRGLHLHLSLGGREVMPGPADIERLPSGLYRWTLPAPAPGEHELRLFWSDADHQPLDQGASQPVRVRME